MSEHLYQFESLKTVKHWKEHLKENFPDIFKKSDIVLKGVASLLYQYCLRRRLSFDMPSISLKELLTQKWDAYWDLMSEEQRFFYLKGGRKALKEMENFETMLTSKRNSATQIPKEYIPSDKSPWDCAIEDYDHLIEEWKKLKQMFVYQLDNPTEED
jgi:hypothetical protein